MAKFKEFFQRKVKSGAPAKLPDGFGAQAQLPPGYLEEHFFLLRRQFLYEKRLKNLEIEVDRYINMSQVELIESFSSYGDGYLDATGLAKVLIEPDPERRRDLLLECKESWTPKSSEEFDPAIAVSEAFDGFEEWLEKRKKK